jgi:hypothetical protein
MRVEEQTSFFGDQARILVEDNMQAINQHRGYRDSQFSRNVIVANSRVIDLGFVPQRRDMSWRTNRGNHGNNLQHLPNLGRRQSIEAMSASLLRHYQFAIKQFCQMKTRRLRRHVCLRRQIEGVQRPSMHQSRQNIGTGRIPEKIRNLRYL